MQRYQGLPASGGVAIGPAWVYRPEALQIERRRSDDPEQEWRRLELTLAQARQQLDELEERARDAVGEEEAAIFEAHRLFLDDVELLDMVGRTIRNDRLNAEAAVDDSFEHYAAMLLSLDNDYFRARAQDVRDVKQRVLRILLGKETASAAALDHPAVILADDLTPSDTIQFERSHILGLCTVRGGPTSHTAILARALGVPAVVSAPLALDEIAPGALVVLDGDAGEVIVEPSAEALAAARARQQRWETKRTAELASANEPAVTRDGHAVEVVANVGNRDDALQAVEMGAEGVGLFRTEFLYLDRDDMPTEAEQVQAYRQVFELMPGRPLVVRTLDIGGDKPAAYLDVAPEANPFLGWRAIRMMDRRPDVLAGQFRALLLAAGQTDADLRIMLPLVSRLEEIERARSLFEEARAALAAEGQPLPAAVQFGMMVEVPSAALLAQHFAQRVDFFSIGTNDLTQYALAVDRTNERVAQLASPFHPAVLKLIAMTLEAAHARGKWVGLCGEFAGDPLATPLLLGLGLDEFSMAPVAIPAVKQEIRRWSMTRCREIARDVLALPTTQAVRRYLQEQS
ncbi:MAG TPA: phosphoenolpyruvate--protein phosphotransferase [Caldilineae bacterium]|nr:phosphoenolpyruvate--protein phosphotransferase [Caldilineae bacterium]